VASTDISDKQTNASDWDVTKNTEKKNTHTTKENHQLIS
jgi:hypothetical protein